MRSFCRQKDTPMGVPMFIMLQFSSFHLLFTILLFLLLLVIFWKKTKAKNLVSKLPPGPQKLPIIGNLHQLAGSLPYYSLRDLAKSYGPIMHLQLGEVSAIVISSPEAAREVLKTHELVFAQRPEVLAIQLISYDHPGLIFSPYGNYWRQMRKICVQELLSAKRVESFRSVREEEVCSLVESISSFHELPINLSKMIFSLTNTVTSRTAFGEKSRGREEFEPLLKELIKYSAGFHTPDLFPSVKFLSLLTGMKPALQRIHKKLNKILDDIINDHKMKIKSTLTSNDEPDGEDLVDVLLRLQESSALSFEITTDHIKIVILDIFIAGTETAATTLEWAMAELMRNPKIMERAQDEVRQVLGRNTRISETNIQKLDYLKSVVKETLRLHPPLPLVPRESKEKCIIEGFEIPSKTRILVNAWALGRDPEHWMNADCFWPERFLSSSIDFKGTNYEFIPFGAGRRICPGISFGLANVELALAQLLYHFDWELPDGIKPAELDMTETFGVTCKIRNELYLQATPFVPFLNKEH